MFIEEKKRNVSPNRFWQYIGIIDIDIEVKEMKQFSAGQAIVIDSNIYVV